MFLASTKDWYLERTIYLIAGLMSVVGFGLGTYVHHYFFFLNLLVGLNLLIFSITGFCIMANLLTYFGIKSKCRLD